MTRHCGGPFLRWDEPLHADHAAGGDEIRVLEAAVLQLSDELRVLRQRLADLERNMAVNDIRGIMRHLRKSEEFVAIRRALDKAGLEWTLVPGKPHPVLQVEKPDGTGFVPITVACTPSVQNPRVSLAKMRRKLADAGIIIET